MKFIKVALDIEEIIKIEGQIQNSDLEELLNNYKYGFENILATMALPLLVIYDGLKSNQELKHRFQASLILKKDIDDNSSEMLEEIKRLRSVDPDNKNLLKDAVEQLNKIPKRYKIMKDSVNNISLYSLVSTWTIFESIMKDLWIYLLNRYPNAFYSILESPINKPIDGIEGKTISIKLLYRYDLNISNKLGFILHTKYDFTSVNGIQKAFADLLKNKKVDLNFFENQYLKQLEIARNNIVHKAGKIDEMYLQRTIYKNEKLGSTISYNINRMNKLHNSAIYCGLNLFKCIDQIISEFKDK